jgi:ferredoxin-type protein NapH
MRKTLTFLLKLKVPLLLFAVFWVIGISLSAALGNRFYLFNFGYIGSALGIGLGVNSLLPRKYKPWGRRLAQFLIGLYMLVFLGFFQHENMQIEGFFFYLLGGLFAGSVIHYLVAKVAGPLLFGRGWCGWACWTAMVLDLLPWRRSSHRELEKKWGFIRYIHFGLSLGTVLILWFVLIHRPESQGGGELAWLLVGNLIYYLVGIALALGLRDNRAFCKVACPIPTLQKLPARFSLLKVQGVDERCTACGACSRVCPMDIDVRAFASDGSRITSTECIQCMECIQVCPQEALRVTFKVDW